MFLGAQLNTYQTVVITVVTLLAPRLLINLRREYYAHILAVDLGTALLPGGVAKYEQHNLAWNVHGPPAAGTNDTYESRGLGETYWSKDVNLSSWEDELDMDDAVEDNGEPEIPQRSYKRVCSVTDE